MKSLHLITVGKLKDKNILSLEAEYLKRIKGFKFKIHEVKTHEENLDLEAKEVLKQVEKINKEATLILLKEKGKEFSSHDFSKYLYEKLENNSDIIFVIGGASGHGEEVLKRANHELSLSKMTYPHKLARLLFIEQIYRAETIKDGHPYSK